MKTIAIIAILVLSGCSHEPPALNVPGRDAETVDLNPGRWTPVTDNLNDMKHLPNVGGTR